MSEVSAQNRAGHSTSAFWTAAAVVVIALWASGSPALVYPLYEQSWSLTPAIITAIFAVYPVVLVIVLLVFGGISDYVGRRATILAGLCSILIGAVIFALAPDVVWLFVGRVFQGVGVGLALSPAGAALIEFDRSGKRASSVNTIAIAVGLTLATVVGGALVQYAPLPRELTFWVLLVAAALVFLAALRLPRHVPGAEANGPWRPRPIRIPRRLRGIVATAALATASSFTVGAVFISLGAQIVKDVLHTENALVAGLVLAVGSACSGVASLGLRGVSPRLAVIIGAAIGALSTAILVLSANLSSLELFILASLLFGVSSGLLFLGGLGLLGLYAPPHHRAGTMSVVYLVAYVGQGITAVGLGILSTAIGLRGGLDVVGPVLIALALATVVAGILWAGRPDELPETGTLPVRP